MSWVIEFPEKFPLEDPAFLNVRSSLVERIHRTIAIDETINLYVTEAGYVVAIENLEGPVTSDTLARVIYELSWS